MWHKAIWKGHPMRLEHAFTVVCQTPRSLAICRIGCWGVSSMIAWTFSMNSLVRVFLGGVLSLHHLQCVELCPQALNHPDLHFEGAVNGPVVITWIGREDELYSSASPISLVEHCVTFRHDRRLLSLLGFVHNLPTSKRSATKKKKKKKKENRFSWKGNGIMSSFLGWQFYRSTLYIWYMCNNRIRHWLTHKGWYTIKHNQPTIFLHITYTCNSVAYYWFFALIQLDLKVLFCTIMRRDSNFFFKVSVSKLSPRFLACVQSQQFFAWSIHAVVFLPTSAFFFVLFFSLYFSYWFSICLFD